MQEEEKVVQEEETRNNQYIDAINELKANTVSKDDYNRLQAENKKLLESVINGEHVEIPEVETKESIDALRAKLFGGDLSNLDYAKTSIDLRDALLEKGESDPFLPYGSKISPTRDDVDCANRVADVLKECIEYADGDSEVFTNELQRRTNDVKYRK